MSSSVAARQRQEKHCLGDPKLASKFLKLYFDSQLEESNLARVLTGCMVTGYNLRCLQDPGSTMILKTVVAQHYLF